MKTNWLRRVLGEGADPAPEDVAAPAPEGAAAPDDAESPVNAPSERVNPTTDNLARAWQSGSKTAVATRILDALDSYADFVSLCFVLGQEDAVELGRIMDELTESETSPRAKANEKLTPDLIDRSEDRGEGIPTPPEA